MREAVIVSTARTPIGRAYRGAFNNTQAQALASHAISNAVARAGVDPAEIDDVVLGTAMQEGSSGQNIARQAALRAGLPVTVPGMTIDRQCSSGLMAIATAAKQIMVDGMQQWVALPYAGPFFVFTFRDAGTDPGHKDDWFGLVSRDFKHKKVAYSTFQSMARTSSKSPSFR